MNFPTVSELPEFGRQLSFLNLGFVLEDSVQNGTKGSHAFSSQTYYDAMKGDVLCFSNPIALESQGRRTNHSEQLESGNAFSNTQEEICVEAITNLTEQEVETQIEESQSLSLSGNLENNIENNLLKPPTETDSARKSLSLSLESVDSGYDNVTLCEDASDTQGQLCTQTQQDSSINNEEQKNKEDDTANNTSSDCDVIKRSPSGSLLEDILQDLKDRAIIGDDPVFNVLDTD